MLSTRCFLFMRALALGAHVWVKREKAHRTPLSPTRVRQELFKKPIFNGRKINLTQDCKKIEKLPLQKPSFNWKGASSAKEKVIRKKMESNQNRSSSKFYETVNFYLAGSLSSSWQNITVPPCFDECPVHVDCPHAAPKKVDVPEEKTWRPLTPPEETKVAEDLFNPYFTPENSPELSAPLLPLCEPRQVI